MKRLALTQRTMRCPMHGCAASLTVRTDSNGAPSHRYLDVVSCSMLPPAPFPPPARTTYFADMAPSMPYLSEVDRAPVHSTEVACAKPCLAVMNAAEPGAAEPIRCTAGMSDAMELARQVQSPALTRLMWFYTA